MKKFLFGIAIILGMGIAYIDSRPTWDDTGITALSLLLVCGLAGLLDPRRPWLLALAVGIWIPAGGILLNHNFGGLLALVFAFAGVYGGVLIHRTAHRLFRQE